MLKRIKIRGKLLLLLVTPVLAVLVFAATGILDRLDKRDFQEREARIADLADAGSDLSLAVQVQRTRGLAADAGADVDLAEAEAATTSAIDRWLTAAEDVRGSITNPDLVDQLDDLGTTLRGLDGGADQMGAGVLLTALSLAGERVELLTPALIEQSADLDLFRALSNHRQMTRVQDAVAKITTYGATSIEQGSVSAVTATLLAAADTQVAIGLEPFLASAETSYVDQVLALEDSGAIPDERNPTVSEIEFLLDTTTDTDATFNEWLATGEERLTSVNAISDAILEDASAAADAAATAADDEANSFLVLAGTVVLLALVMAIVVGRSVSRPLTRLTRNAEQLSTEELPALVEALRSGGRIETPELTPIDIKGRDEVATLAGAISEIQQVTVEVAEEQGELLRRGISDIFVNLARRNQSLLDRQIDFIDQLEAREENPDQLENLFRLDHLATRMRRNAESLLVLAGAEPTRRRGRPVELADVVRVAMGEIEDYSRIRLHTIDPGTVAGSVAVDLAHLLSELMENATQFSPPETGVEVVGHHAGDGSYRLTLTDKGIGMSTEAINTANQTLAEPPLVGLDLSRSLGFTVVSRLAHRLGVSVALESSAQGGVTATVTVPADMIGESVPEAPTPPEMPAPAAPTVSAPSPSAEAPRPNVPAPSPPPIAIPMRLDEAPPAPIAGTPAPSADGMPTPLPRRTREASVEAPASSLPAPPPPPTAEPAPSPAPAATSKGDLFEAFSPSPSPPAPPADPDADMFAPLDPPVALPRRVRPDAAAAPAGVHAAPPTAPLPTRRAADVAAVDSSVTEAGLVRRTPRQVDVPDSSMFSPGPVSSTTAPTRSPEEVRQMLSRYRSGLRKGRGPGAGSPRDDAPNPSSSPAEGDIR